MGREDWAAQTMLANATNAAIVSKDVLGLRIAIFSFLGAGSVEEWMLLGGSGRSGPKVAMIVTRFADTKQRETVPVLNRELAGKDMSEGEVEKVPKGLSLGRYGSDLLS
jgi:hypothetical protein